MSAFANTQPHHRPNPSHVPVSRFFSDKKTTDHNYNGPPPGAPTAPASMRPVSPPALRRRPNYPSPVPPRITTSSVEDDSDIFGPISANRDHRSPFSRSAVGDKTRAGNLSHHSSTDSLRRQLNVDDASSNASTSSRASRAKNVCRSCKQEGGQQVRRLISCTSCNRRYHAYCGDPKPISVADGEKFICGKCRLPPARTETDGTTEVVASPIPPKAQPTVIDAPNPAKRKGLFPAQPNETKRQKLDTTPFSMRDSTGPTAESNHRASALTTSLLSTWSNARYSSNPASLNGRDANTSAINKTPQAHPKIGSSWRYSLPVGQEIVRALGVPAGEPEGLNHRSGLDNKPNQQAKLQNRANTWSFRSQSGSLDENRAASSAGLKLGHGPTQVGGPYEPHRAGPEQGSGLRAHSPNHAQVLSKTHRSSPLGAHNGTNTISPARNTSLSNPPGRDISHVQSPRPISPIQGVDTPFSPVPTVGSDIPDSLPSPRLGPYIPSNVALDGLANDNARKAPQASKFKQRSTPSRDGAAERTADPRLLSGGYNVQGIPRLQTPQKLDSKLRNPNEVGTPRSTLDGKFSMSKAAKKGNFSIRKCETPECTRRVWKAARCEECQQKSKLEGNHKVPESTSKLEKCAVSELRIQHAAPPILALTAASVADEHQPTGKSAVPTTLARHSASTSAPSGSDIRPQLGFRARVALQKPVLSPLLVAFKPNFGPSHHQVQPPDVPSTDYSSVKPPATATIDDDSPRSSESGNGRPTTSPSLDESTTVTSVGSGFDLTRKAPELQAQEDPTNASFVQDGSDTSRPQSVKSRSTCDECHRDHKKCLHDENGDLDPALCKAWFDTQKPSSMNSGRPVSEQQQIRAAALKYTATSSTVRNEQKDEAATSRQDNNQDDKILGDPNRNDGTSFDPGDPKRDSGFQSDSSDDQPIMARRNAMRKLSSEKGKEAGMAPKAVTSSLLRSKSRKDASFSTKGEAGGRVKVKEIGSKPPKRRNAPGSGRLPAYAAGLVTTAAGISPAARVEARISAPVSRDMPLSPLSKIPDYTFISPPNLSPYGKTSKSKISIEVPSRRPSPSRDAAMAEAGPPRPAIDAVVTRLKGRGVTFEEESSDEEMEDDSPNQASEVKYPWQSVQNSKSLYDVAPMLRTPSATGSSQNTFVSPSTGKSRSKKAIWKNLLHHQLRERREKHGVDHPHRILEPAGIETMITTTKLQDSTTQSWRDPLDPPVPEKVQMRFSDFMDMPADPIFDHEESQRKGQKHELAFRDGKKERAWIQSGATRRTRNQGVDQRWLFMR